MSNDQKSPVFTIEIKVNIRCLLDWEQKRCHNGVSLIRIKSSNGSLFAGSERAFILCFSVLNCSYLMNFNWDLCRKTPCWPLKLDLRLHCRFRDTGVYIKVNCISTEFTPKKHGGEKGVPFRLQVTWNLNFEIDQKYWRENEAPSTFRWQQWSRMQPVAFLLEMSHFQLAKAT